MEFTFTEEQQQLRRNRQRAAARRLVETACDPVKAVSSIEEIYGRIVTQERERAEGVA